MTAVYNTHKDMSYFAQTILNGKNYAWEKEGGTRETWEEVAHRVAWAVCKGYIPDKVIGRIEKLIYERKFLPGGRYLYAAGRKLRAINNCFDGDTRIITSEGVFSLRDLSGKTVQVMNRYGDWEQAEVKSFGKQKVHDLKFTNGDVVKCTLNHRWWLEDGSRVTTVELDKVPLCKFADVPDLDEEGIRHGVVFGDGTTQKTVATDRLVLCAEHKRPLVSYFSEARELSAGLTVTKLPKKYKSLPSGNVTPEYARGFIAGLLATDGSTKTSSVTISCEGLEKARRIRDLAVLGGCVVSGIHVQTKGTNYNSKSRELAAIRIKPFSAPLIRPDQIKDLEARNLREFKMHLEVESVDPQGEEVEVFCAVVPGSESFVLANGLVTSNCFLLKCTDSKEGWADLTQRAMLCLMLGGGIGADYSEVREEGALVNGLGGFCTGPLSPMQIVNEAGRHIKQGGSRRAAIWARLQWDHSDVKKFIAIKDWPQWLVDQKKLDFNVPAPMDCTNISVGLNTKFFSSLAALDPVAEDVYWDTVRHMVMTAEPGFSIDCDENEGEILRNACVPTGTEILTSKGYERIEDTIGQETEVWNGFEWSTVTPKVTGHDEKLVRVSLSSGQSLTCTEYHQFVTVEGYAPKQKVTRVAASELQIGQKLLKVKYPVVQGGKDVEYAYAQGFVSAEGMDGYDSVYVYGDKKYCLERLAPQTRLAREDKTERYDRVHVRLNYDLLPKSFVPFSWSVQSRLDWVAGFLDGDGTVLIEGGVQAGSVDRAFILNVQKLLTTLGVQSKVTLGQVAGMKPLPDGNGGLKLYPCKDFYRLLIGAVQVQNLVSLGMKCERLYVVGYAPNRDASQFVTVTGVEEAGVADVVYCFDEPLRHMGCFEGVVTGQCTELTSADDSDCCNIGSLVLPRFSCLDEFKEAIPDVIAFLLCGTVYGELPYGQVYKVREKNRRLGLGLMGMHEWLLRRGYQYGKNEELQGWLEAYAESTYIAHQICDSMGISRSVKTRAIAPTGTISIVAETTSGIEPIFATSFLRRYLKGSTWMAQYVVDAAAERLIKDGVDPETIEDAYDLAEDYERRIAFQAWVQEYVDHGISSTLNLPEWGSSVNNEDTVKGFGKVLLKYLGKLRGITAYPDGCRGGQPLTKVPYSEAIKHLNREFEANSEVTVEEVGNERACVNGVCGM